MSDHISNSIREKYNKSMMSRKGLFASVGAAPMAGVSSFENPLNLVAFRSRQNSTKKCIKCIAVMKILLPFPFRSTPKSTLQEHCI